MTDAPCVLCGHRGPVKPSEAVNGGGLPVCADPTACLGRWPEAWR